MRTNSTIRLGRIQYRELAGLAKQAGCCLGLSTFEKLGSAWGMFNPFAVAVHEDVSKPEYELEERVVIELATTVDLARLRSVVRPEIDWANLDDDEAFKFITHHEIGHYVDNHSGFSAFGLVDTDDTHIDLIRAFYALSVLFKRKTGHEAKQVAKDHWEAMGRHLLEGAPLPDQQIPLVTAPVVPMPPAAFVGLTNLELACAAFNYSDQVHESLMDHSPKALAMSQARVTALDATTALRKLVLRLSGGSVAARGSKIKRQPGETLQ